MRGAESKQSLGEGAAWRGMKGYGWDATALKNAATAVNIRGRQRRLLANIVWNTA